MYAHHHKILWTIGGFTGPDGKTVRCSCPTWNAQDQDGGNDYWRGSCTYRTSFSCPDFDPASQQVWLQFDGVNASAGCC